MKATNNLRSWLAIATMSLMASLTYAQDCKLDICAPKFEKFITVTADGVNIRRAPSSTAPRLMRWCEGETDVCGLVWSDQKGYRGAVPRTAYDGETMTAIEELPEWYRVIGSEGFVAYISKKFTRELNVQNVTIESMSQPSYLGYDVNQIVGVRDGEYKGYAMLQENGFDSDGISFGRIVNGMLVFNHHVSGFVNITGKKGRITAEVKDDYMNIEAGTDVCRYDSTNESYILDMGKLTAEEFKMLMQKAGIKQGKTSDRGIIFGCINGKLEKLCEYDLSDAKLANLKVIVPAK